MAAVKRAAERMERLVMQDVIGLCNMILRDCEEYASSLDGKPLDGMTVAEAFGNTLGFIAGVTLALQKTAERIDSDKATPMAN